MHYKRKRSRKTRVEHHHKPEVKPVGDEVKAPSSKKGKKRTYPIEFRWTRHWNKSIDLTKWYTWKRYRDEASRNEAFEALKKKKGSGGIWDNFYEFRIPEEEKVNGDKVS